MTALICQSCWATLKNSQQESVIWLWACWREKERVRKREAERSWVIESSFLALRFPSGCKTPLELELHVLNNNRNWTWACTTEMFPWVFGFGFGFVFLVFLQNNSQPQRRWYWQRTELVEQAPQCEVFSLLILFPGWKMAFSFGSQNSNLKKKKVRDCKSTVSLTLQDGCCFQMNRESKKLHWAFGDHYISAHLLYFCIVG